MVDEIRWTLWGYATQPGWEGIGAHATREAARDDRRELIDHDGYPSDWVAVRRTETGPPKRRASKAAIAAVLAASHDEVARG